MKEVAQYEDVMVAEVAKGALANEGIDAAVMNYSSAYPGIFRVKLMVNDEDYDRAKEVLNRKDSE